MKLTFYFLFLMLFCNCVKAQKTDSTSCPKIIILGPAQNTILSGQQARLSVKQFKKSFLKDRSLTYEWAVNNGSIVGEKDKRNVVIDTKNLQGQQIKVIVIVTGLNDGCPTSEILTLNVVNETIIKTETKIVRRPAF